MMRLPSVLDSVAAAPLRVALLEARGAPITIDATDVERLGGLSLQVLLAARATWSADGHSFQIVQTSPAFAEGAQLMAAKDLIQGGDFA